MSSFSDAIVDALEEFLRTLLAPVETLIETHGDTLLRTIVGTPMPDVVIGRPSVAPWPALYDYYWSDIVPLALLLWSLSVGIVIFLESTSHLFSGYHQSRLKRRAFVGLVGILSWWWLAALSLRFANALAGAILPDLSAVSLFQTLSFGGVATITLAVSLSVDLALFLLLALVYVGRIVVLYLFVLLVPLLIALWVPGLGPFAYVSRFVQRLAGFYVPFLLMPIPVAVLLRLAAVLGEGFALDTQGLFLWVVALVIPVVAVLSPFVLVWQAGSLLQTGERVARHTSRARGQARLTTVRGSGQQAVQGGRDFTRGVRGAPPTRPDGQTVLQGSRAHTAGRRLNASGTTLHSRVTRRPDHSTNTSTRTRDDEDD
ncbi:hypothetical protein [Halarchaeum sp. P4]|uniref:hypothetical protein n=1 Tax=Halarchaeum sp. P4 TaxID=3421639 RepID=UPI003EBEFFE0